MERLTKNVVFVVEGKNDYSKLKHILPDANIITTNGSEVSDTVLNEIKLLSFSVRVILLLDPDGPGEKIRRKISDVVPNAEHIYVDKKLAISSNKKKVGIEHLSDGDLLNALSCIKVPNNITNYINVNDLYELGLVGKTNSKKLRQQLCDELGIGTANSKTLVYKLNMFGISLEEIKDIIKVRL